MSLTQNRWFRRLGFAAVAALGVAGSAMLTAPAQAHDFAYHRAPIVHHTAFFPRIFFGWHQGYGNHWDHHRR